MTDIHDAATEAATRQIVDEVIKWADGYGSVESAVYGQVTLDLDDFDVLKERVIKKFREVNGF